MRGLLYRSMLLGAVCKPYRISCKCSCREYDNLVEYCLIRIFRQKTVIESVFEKSFSLIHICKSKQAFWFSGIFVCFLADKTKFLISFCVFSIHFFCLCVLNAILKIVFDVFKQKFDFQMNHNWIFVKWKANARAHTHIRECMCARYLYMAA